MEKMSDKLYYTTVTVRHATDPFSYVEGVTESVPAERVGDISASIRRQFQKEHGGVPPQEGAGHHEEEQPPERKAAGARGEERLVKGTITKKNARKPTSNGKDSIWFQMKTQGGKKLGFNVFEEEDGPNLALQAEKIIHIDTHVEVRGKIQEGEFKGHPTFSMYPCRVVSPELCEAGPPPDDDSDIPF